MATTAPSQREISASNAAVMGLVRLDGAAPGGAERYEATPYANMRPNGAGWLPAITISQWGRGIAQFAEAAAR